MAVRAGRAQVVPAFGADILPPVGTRFSTGADLALLNGPGSAPGGAVTVTPGGTKLDALTNSNAAGTTFYLTAGTHTLGTSGSPSFGDQVIPKDGNIYIGAPGAILSGQGVAGSAFNGSAVNVTVSYLEITGFVAPTNEFVCNHGAGDGWTFSYCNMHDNQGAAIGCGSNTTVQYCWLHDNGQYGFSAYKYPTSPGTGCAVSNVTIDHCEIAHNGTLADEIDPGTGIATGRGRNAAGKFLDTENMVVTNNWIHHSNWVGIWADTSNVALLVQNNLIEYNYAAAIFYEISYNFKIADNTIRGNALGQGIYNNNTNDSFPVAALYISESGGDSAVSSTYAASEITRNRFVDNWSDITLWENADRVCNNPFDSGSQIYIPKGHGATLAICNQSSSKTLTVTLTSGSPNFTVTSGTLEFTDNGRPASGTGIPGGALIDPPTFANGYTGGYISSSTGKMSANATSSGSVTMTLAAGDMGGAGLVACRWHTQNITVTGNSFDHNEARVLNGVTLASFVHTGNMAIAANFGTGPSWSPYLGFTIQNAIVGSQNIAWHNNYYRGTFNFVAKDQSNTITFSDWTGTYSQDANSVVGGAAP